jgi:hypothetical protein
MSIHHVSKTKLNSSHTIFNNLQTLTSTLEILKTHVTTQNSTEGCSPL